MKNFNLLLIFILNIFFLNTFPQQEKNEFITEYLEQYKTPHVHIIDVTKYAPENTNEFKFGKKTHKYWGDFINLAEYITMTAITAGFGFSKKVPNIIEYTINNPKKATTLFILGCIGFQTSKKLFPKLAQALAIRIQNRIITFTNNAENNTENNTTETSEER